MTFPMTTAEPKRYFSTFKRMKSYLRNAFNQKRLIGLYMISIEKEILSLISNFKEKVIEFFCHVKEILFFNFFLASCIFYYICK